MKNNEKRWSDQPDEVLQGQVVLNTLYKDRAVEVRSCPDGTYYVTTGNLFGSQTVACRTVEQLLAVLQLASDAKGGKPVSVPSGVRLLDGRS